MAEHVDKTPDRKSKAAGYKTAQPFGSFVQESEFVDNRMVGVMQRKLQEVADKGRKESQLKKEDFSRFQETKAGVVQRKIGFEFEVEVPLYHKAGGEDFFGQPKKQETKFSKDEKLYNCDAFHIVQDHSAGSSSSVNTIPEFVIHPQEESLPKENFIKYIQNALDFIDQLKSNKYPNTNILQIGETFAGDAQIPFTVMRSGGSQATFGVLPEGVSSLFENKVERVNQSMLYESDILGRANIAAKNLIANPLFETSTEKNKIEGFLALICMYCVSNSISGLQHGPALDKNKVPFLVRSTMAEIAIQTLNDDSRRILGENIGVLTELIIRETKANSGEPIISPTSAEKDKKLNVTAQEWVQKALQCEDQPLKWGSMEDGSDSKLIHPEKTGSLLPNPEEQDTRSFGAIVEERNLVQGSVMVQNWVDVAGRVWEYVRKANRIQE
jgi:hypothetical protein